MRKFYTLDVFTSQTFAGNPLAVVLDCEGLSDAMMQTIASEFNLSETVFVSPPNDASNRAAIRIFTPAHELPFAGHPTVGTAILLNHLNHLGEGDELVLEEQVGPVRCVISESDGVKTARFDLPKVATTIDHPFDAQGWACALGVPVNSIDTDSAGLWDGGVPYTIVPVASLDDVTNVQINTAKIADVEPVINGLSSNPYVVCQGGVDQDTDFHARMFAPNFGIPEDPATGSAVASLSGWIAKHIMADSEARSFKIEQGYEMGRPSQILLDIETRDGVVVSAGISGSAVIVSEGVLHL